VARLSGFFLTAVMLLPSRTPAASVRRLLALAVAVAQLVGSIGIAPVRAGSPDSSDPYPCQNHPCGCRTAAACWAGPCCCFTMREKVAWANENGVAPPEHALRLAAEEPAVSALPSCCAVKPSPAKSAGHDSGAVPNASPRHLGWVASLFAKKCQGQLDETFGVLTLGLAPAVPRSWSHELPFAGFCLSPDRDSTSLSPAPQSPPPRG
jgi:hypothetical protein